MAKKEYYYNTFLKSWTDFTLVSDDPDIVGLSLHIFKNNKELSYDLLSLESKQQVTYINIHLLEEINLEDTYIVQTNDIKKYLDLSHAPAFSDFDNRYAIKDVTLGPIYYPDRTIFNLWAPLARKVTLSYQIGMKKFEKELIRLPKGLFTTMVDGDLDGALYSYIIEQNNETFEVIDPYSKSGNLNMKKGAVIDVNKIKNMTGEKNLPVMKNYVDAIIYELNVRDFTIYKNTGIVNKGKFLGLIEPNRHTPKGNKAGFDYLKSLGISHVQLLPILSIDTIDETREDKTYNWGYDPYHYFALEGSYSCNPNDPYKRMYEFKEVVNEFHKAGLRINLDVVYNHMYDSKNGILQKIVPNYYFRIDKDFKFIDQSFCGNALSSERVMTRKLILDSTRFLVETYDIDGFRFDLMGLTDARTINDIYRMCLTYKKDIMLYGEGWNMAGDRFNHHLMANMNNASQMPNIGFFNDSFRNIFRGPGHKAQLDEQGYLLGNASYIEGFKYAYLGSTIDYCFGAKFKSLNQSINYVECHDNATISDVIDNSTLDTSVDKIRRLKMINKTLLLSFGVPFIHMGQEIGLSKFSHHNTYNEGDKYNQFNYDLLDERIDLYNSFKNYIVQRKSIPFFKIADPEILKKSVKLKTVEGAVVVEMENKDISDTIYTLVINPTKKTIYQDFEYEVEDYIFEEKRENVLTHHGMIFALSTKLFR